jgi:uncharacterized OsmC-like protein/uncharacterized metal-binding protein
MDSETIRIEKVVGTCPACEDYATRNSTMPAKVAVMACEGACARGEVARRAANLVAHRLASEETVRICLGGAFTKDTGQRNLVRRADRVIAIEGCFIRCSSRMMAGVLPDLRPEIVRADLIYDLDLPFGIDEVPDEMFTIYAHRVAAQVADGIAKKRATPASTACCTPAPSDPCSAGPMHLPPDVVTVAWEGERRVRAENSRGGALVLGEGANQSSAVDALLAALGGCVNVAVLGQLQRLGRTLDALRTEVTGTRCAGVPAAFETFHIRFSIATTLDDAALEAICREAVTVLCPVAVTLGRAAAVTWEYRRV